MESQSIHESDVSSKKGFELGELTVEKVMEDDSDAVQLAKMGYKSEFRREFTNLSTISFAFSILGATSSIASTINTPFASGGASSVIWCWFIGTIGSFCLGTSIAEIVSAYPSTGGLYSASARLVPDRWKAVVGYLVGWLMILGQFSVICSVEFSVAEMILAGASMATEGDFSPSTGLTVGLFIALLVFHGLFSCLATKQMAYLTRSFIFINLGSLVLICITLLATCKDMHSAMYVFTDFQNGTGWENDGIAFLLGTLSVAWTITDLDAAAHISEECKNASVVVPISIWWSVIGTGVLGWILNICLVITSGPLEELPGVSGYAMAQIIYRNTGMTGFIVLWSLVCLTGMTVVATELQAVARNVYAFARDGGMLPMFAKLSTKAKVPVNATVLVVFCAAVLGLLDLVSSIALNAVFALATIALDLGALIPIVCRLIFQDHPEVNFVEGPFSLGRSGWKKWTVSILTIIWTCFVIFILALPQVMPVDASNMNYASGILGLVMMLSGLWFALRAHKTYLGPKNLVQSMGIIVGSLSLTGEEKD